MLVEKHASIEELKEKLEIEKEAEKDQKAGRRPFFTEWLERYRYRQNTGIKEGLEGRSMFCRRKP